MKKSKNKRKEFNKNMSVVLLAAVILVIFGYVFMGPGFLYRTSILSFPMHEKFDGTTFPIKKVPNWSMLETAKLKLPYSELKDSDLIDIPYYDPNQLSTSTDTLVWKNKEDNKIRNAKITYPVEYLGNYKLDGKENVGSHPAVDIKIPEGTPVYAIANGTVIKSANQTSGFGKHIVLQHNNFPSLDDPTENEVLYSSYNHLSSILVNVGDVVKKGQQIALSGSTGTATTPHLHFQIDNANADWHPYWPFTWKEASNAGLDFFSAINAGLGKDVAAKTTVNPMKYVQKYLDFSAPASSENSNEDTSTPSNNEPAKEDTNVAVVNENTTGVYANNESNNVVINTIVKTEEAQPEVEVVAKPETVSNTDENVEKVLNFEFKVPQEYVISANSEFTVKIRDQFGNLFNDGFTGDIVIKTANDNAKPNEVLVNIIKFNTEGEYSGFLENMSAGKDKLVVEYNGNTYYSNQFEIVDKSSTLIFSDLADSNKYYNAIMYLVKEGVVVGYPDSTFKPDKTVTRIEALKFILEGTNTDLSSGKLKFKDTSNDDWYSKYLFTANKRKIVSGYEDKTFRPSNSVTKSEFYKMLLKGMKVKTSDFVAEKPFEDVPADAWFAPYFAKAKELGVIDSSITKINPTADMSRGEVSDAIYRLSTALNG